MAPFDDVDRGRASWWVAATVLAAVLAYIVYTFAGTFVFGFFLYYATRPVYRRLKGHIGPPTVAAIVSLVILALPAILLAAYTTAVGLQELDAVLAAQNADLGQFETLLAPYLDVSQAVEDPQSLLDEPSVQSALGTVAENSAGYLGVLGTAFIHLFAMITIAFYLLRDDHRLASWFRRRFANGDGVLEAYTDAVDRDFSNIFFGNILFAFITGVVAAIAYNALNAVSPAAMSIPYPTLLGMLTGAASLIPVVGIKLVWIPMAGWLAFVAFQGDVGFLFVAVFVAVAAVVVDFIPDLVVRPYVSGRDLHLGLVILAYVFGPLVWGWYGLFLGPMVLVLVVHFGRLVLPELVAGVAIEPVPNGRVYGEPGGPPAEADVEHADSSAAADDASTNDSTDETETGSADGPSEEETDDAR
jgi:predicted PurR-regulated permease PerM